MVHLLMKRIPLACRRWRQWGLVLIVPLVRVSLLRKVPLVLIVEMAGIVIRAWDILMVPLIRGFSLLRSPLV